MLLILDDTAQVKYTYELDAPLTDKIDAVAKIYREAVSATVPPPKDAGQ